MNIKAKVSHLILRIQEKKHLTKLRKRNKNLNPTIVCNNCVAGVIYHNLGLKFNSPTINLAIKGVDYLEFVKNFEYYSSCTLEEIQDNQVDYPVGKLVANDEQHQDITIHFQHYSTFAEAKRKWQERYSRVNWNNVFYIWEFYDTLYDTKYMYDFDQLDIERKMLLTHREFVDLKNASRITCYDNDRPFGKILEYNGLSGKRYLDEFDYVSFLNGNN